MTESKTTEVNTLLADLQMQIDAELKAILASFSFEAYLTNKPPVIMSSEKTAVFNIVQVKLTDAERLAQSKLVYAKLIDALNYSVLSGGKRIRPLLCLLWGNYCLALADCKVDDLGKFRALRTNLASLLLKLAIAIELIHSYSLVHDDLPAMDNSTYRRGKLTVHKQYGEAVGILAGDALLTLAFQQLSELDFTLDAISYQRLFSVQTELAKLAGMHGMVAGQMLDLTIQPNDCQLEDYLACISGKTAALIEASICLPSKLLANLTPKSQQDLSKVAYYWGLLFQMQDDRLDKNEVGQAKNILQYVNETELANWENDLCVWLKVSLEAIFERERYALPACENARLTALGQMENALLIVLRKLERRKQ